MKNIIKKVAFVLVIFSINHSYAMQEWYRSGLESARTRLENLGVIEARPANATEELKQIINRYGSFKPVGGITKAQDLVARKADVNVVGSDGKTALFIAVGDNDPLTVRLLAEYVGADINKNYGEGRTLLAIAAGDGKPALIPILARFGANVNSIDDQGNTPLMLAARLVDQDVAIQVADRLLKLGANIDAQNKAGETALYRAVQRKKNKLIEFLVSNGANLAIANNQGQTPIALAQAINDPLIIKALVARNIQKIP